MNRKSRRLLKKRQKENLKQLNLNDKLTELLKEDWPDGKDNNRIKVYISKKYMVQIFKENNNLIRLSINKTSHDGLSWTDGIPWDELQKIKNEVGYEDFDAVEIYPKERDVVNVSNMRHLWVMPEQLSFGWRKD